MTLFCCFRSENDATLELVDGNMPTQQNMTTTQNMPTAQNMPTTHAHEESWDVSDMSEHSSESDQSLDKDLNDSNPFSRMEKTEG